MGCTSGYKFPASGLGQVDMDDVFVRKEFFSEGGLWLWGCGTESQLGNNLTSSRSSPVQTVSAGTNWKCVSAGSYHTAGIKSDGSLWLWGTALCVNFFLDMSGALGDNTRVDKSSPVQTVSGGTNWKQVSLGYTHSASIKTDGTLWLWGNNTGGQLGDNTRIARSSPVQTVSVGTNWKQVSLGCTHSAAIKTDGTLWLWGCGTSGRLGTNLTTDYSSPVQTVSGGTNWKQVSSGINYTSAIKTDGTLWMWGYGVAGNLGNNDVIDKSSPVQTVSGGTNWKQVSSGGINVAAIKTDGTLWVWGEGSAGRLGTNLTTDYSSPVQTVSGGTNWKQVSSGYYHMAGIREDCW